MQTPIQQRYQETMIRKAKERRRAQRNQSIATRGTTFLRIAIMILVCMAVCAYAVTS